MSASKKKKIVVSEICSDLGFLRTLWVGGWEFKKYIFFLDVLVVYHG